MSIYAYTNLFYNETNPLQVSSIVFLVNRYMGLLASLISIWEFTYHATMNLVLDILTLRVLALYSQSKRLAIALYTLFGIESALMLFCFVYGTVKEQVAVGGVDKYVFCGIDVDVSPAIQMISWVSVFTYESILLFLVLYRSTIIYKETGRRFKSTELVTVLVKDQILYFIAVMVPAIASIIESWLSPTEDDDAMIVVMNIFTSPSIPCIVGSLLMFNLREAAQRGVNGGTSISLNARTEGTMVFT
ncbi:hypothetical protein PNOK_0165600 [Pyrrhoderma noxium]|uniref:Uncharacterized protein n=1 Tax=Pyrrhoderma noxium TaxID=2282107 RepID=A0A286UQ80_9AGAM|nr:hypothetical protein PNOK_0165600 [Pyrrhoderma noxium]